MATTRFSTASNLLGGNRFGVNQENADGLVGKAAAGKSRLTTTTARSALGNISNKAVVASTEASKKGLKQDNVAAKPRLAKSATTNALPGLRKENVPVQKPETPSKSPCPMDMSISSPEAFSKHFLPPNVADIDREDKDNPQLVSEYVKEIYNYMRELEQKMSIRPRYLDGLDINGRMRSILIDWIVQVHNRFHLLQETLYLTVAVIDRFLQEQEVKRDKLQLVGVTAMLVASKYEEMYAPEIADFVYITDNAYTKADIRKMERMILQTLDFNLGKPLPLHFLRRNSKAGEVDATKHTLAKYLMELTLVDYDMVHYNPSQVAAAALCLSMKILDITTWTDTLHHYSKYSEQDLLPIMQRICLLLTKAGTGKLTAIRTKYSSSKFMRIASIPELKCQTVQDLAAAVAR